MPTKTTNGITSVMLIISLNNSVLERAVLVNKSGSLSWGNIYICSPSLEAKPCPAKNINNSVWFFLILGGNHLSKVL